MNEKLLGVVGVGDSPTNTPSLLDNTVVTPNKPSFCTKVKIVTYGKMMDVEIFEKPIRTGVPPQKHSHYRTDDEIYHALTQPEIIEQHIADRKAEYRRRTANLAKTNIRRLVQANFDMSPHFLTLTFKDTDQFDISSLSDCHQKYESFITKLRACHPKFKYLAVPEFQKRGAVHYHVINNLPFIPVEKYRQLWIYGFIKVNQINDPSLVGIYIAKYIGKNVHDHRFIGGHRLYYCSRGLTKPKVRYGDQYLSKIQLLKDHGIQPQYQKEFPTEWNGKKTISLSSKTNPNSKMSGYEKQTQD